MTLGREITLAQILDLHNLDSGSSSSSQTTGGPRMGNLSEIAFPPISNPATLEEMRRSFWELYIFESYVSARVGRPCTLEEAKLRIYLPSPGELTTDFVPSPMPFLNDPTKLSSGVAYL